MTRFLTIRDSHSGQSVYVNVAAVIEAHYSDAQKRLEVIFRDGAGKTQRTYLFGDEAQEAKRLISGAAPDSHAPVSSPPPLHPAKSTSNKYLRQALRTLLLVVGAFGLIGLLSLAGLESAGITVLLVIVIFEVKEWYKLLTTSDSAPAIETQPPSAGVKGELPHREAVE